MTCTYSLNPSPPQLPKHHPIPVKCTPSNNPTPSQLPRHHPIQRTSTPSYNHTPQQLPISSLRTLTLVQPLHQPTHTPTRPPPPACQSGSSRPAAQPSTPSPFRSTTAQTATEWLCPSNNQFDAAQSGSRLTNSQLPDVLLGNKWPLQLRNPLGSKTNE